MRPHERLRASRWPVALGFGLALTGLWFPWWGRGGATAGLWADTGIADMAAVRMSSGLLVFGLLVAGVRLGVASWANEPKAWRREIALAAAFLLAAPVIGLWWPLAGGFMASGSDVVPAGPMLGWYTVLMGGLLVAYGRWMARVPPGAAAALALMGADGHGPGHDPHDDHEHGGEHSHDHVDGREQGHAEPDERVPGQQHDSGEAHGASLGDASEPSPGRDAEGDAHDPASVVVALGADLPHSEEE